MSHVQQIFLLLVPLSNLTNGCLVCLSRYTWHTFLLLLLFARFHLVAIAVTRFNKVKENKRGCDVLDNREEERQRPQSSFQPCCGPIDQNCPLKWENFAFWEWKPDRDHCSDPQSPPESAGPAHGYGLCLLFLNPGLWSWKSLWISECLVGGEKTHCRDSTADANRLKIVFLPYSFYPFRCSGISRFPRQAAVQLRVEGAHRSCRTQSAPGSVALWNEEHSWLCGDGCLSLTAQSRSGPDSWGQTGTQDF